MAHRDPKADVPQELWLAVDAWLQAYARVKRNHGQPQASADEHQKWLRLCDAREQHR